MADEEEQRARPIRSDYYFGVGERKKLVKTTRASSAFMVVPRAMMHMQTNEYGANVVEIFDEKTGTLHAVLRMKLNGSSLPDIRTLFKRKVKKAVKP